MEWHDRSTRWTDKDDARMSELPSRRSRDRRMILQAPRGIGRDSSPWLTGFNARAATEDTQAPRGGNTQVPSGQEPQAPRGQYGQAPRDEDIQAPVTASAQRTLILRRPE
jgi:hypothetical protein